MHDMELKYATTKIFAVYLLILAQLLMTHSRSLNNNFRELSAGVTDKIDGFVNSLIACSSLIGTNIAVVQNGETVFSKGYGHIDLETEGEVTSDTLFSIGSITKSITSVLLGKILYENGLTWDSKVMEVLSDQEFQFIDPFLTCQVTFKDLAAHRTGVPSRNFAATRNMTRKELVRRMRYSRREGQFRNGFTYNNNLYGIMAYIIEKLSGRNFEQLVRDEIFVPLKMNSSTFLHEMDLSDERLAQPYFADPLDGNRVRPVKKLTLANFDRVGAGAGMVVSTAEDMAQYMKLHLGNGQVDDLQILPPAVIAETHGRYTNILWSQFVPPQFPAPYELSAYGLGAISGSYRGYRLVHFEGALRGYGSMAHILPDAGLGIYAHGTAADEVEARTQRSLLLMYISDLFLGVEPWLDEFTVCSFPTPWCNESTPAKKSPNEIDGPDNLSPYHGTYGNFQFGNVSVIENNNSSSRWLELTYGAAKWMLRPIAEHVFLGVPDDKTFPLYLLEVIFRKQPSETELFEEVTFNILGTDPNVFERDIKLSDEPPMPAVSCNLDFSNNAAAHLTSPVFFFIYIAFCVLFK